MRHLLRRPLSGLGLAICLLSLLAALGAAWLWTGRTARLPERLPHVSVRAGSSVYTLRAGDRGLWLGRPPRGPTAAGEAKAKRLVALLNNRDVHLRRWWRQDHPEHWSLEVQLFYQDKSFPAASPGYSGSTLYVGPSPYSGVYELRAPQFAEAVGPLLEALANPERFIAAHDMLCARAGDPHSGPVVESGGRLVASCDGLAVDLGVADKTLQHDMERQPPIRVDPAQIPDLIESWRRRLDVPVASISYGKLTAVLALPPLLWLAVRSRRIYVRRRRRRLGLCLQCGYDLTGNTSGRCSECGKSIL